MELEYSLPCPLEQAINPYHGSDELNPHPDTLFL
jgi:hypothetical protein